MRKEFLIDQFSEAYLKFLREIKIIFRDRKKSE